MRKELTSIFIFSMILLSFVNAGQVINMPDNVNSFEEYKQRVLDANSEDGLLAIATSNYWGVCDQTCANLVFQGDCSPCSNGGVTSLRTWHPDSMSVMDTWTSANNYCNDWLKPYNYYNQQAFCTVPSVECSGAGSPLPGDRKCDRNDVLECSNSGVWEYQFDCDYDCNNGKCIDEQCYSHDEKKCSGASVYWYDSCGDRQEEYERCESDEVCEGDSCVRICSEEFIGEKLCSGNTIVQQYQLSDCSTEIRTVEECESGCENSVCTIPQCSSCPDPTAWSQCADESMFRTNYKCSESSNYECVAFTENEACECGTSEQCNYNEVCDESVCVEVECGDGEIADSHECVKVFPTSMIIWISVGAVAFIFVIIIISLMVRLKGGRNRNGKNKKRF